MGSRLGLGCSLKYRLVRPNFQIQLNVWSHIINALSVLMTKKKPTETEVVEGAGSSSSLRLILKPGTKSGHYGVIPNGKRWRARVYKPSKQKWDDVGTYNTPRDAAIQAAIAQQEVNKGFGCMYSPLKERAQTGE